MISSVIVHKKIKSFIPSFLKEWIKKVAFGRKLNKIQEAQRSELNRIRNKEKIRVVFLLIHETVWKYEGLYRLMEQDERFEPVVVVCPYTNDGEDTLFREMNQAFAAFKKKEYNVFKTFDDKNRKWIDIKSEFKPDIVCFTNPWNLTKNDYQIENFLDKLTCFVPYGYETTYNVKAYYDKPIHNFCWLYFLESGIHKSYSIKYSKNSGANTEVTGYPGIDFVYKAKEEIKTPWRTDKKRIIWAPHHTISDKYNYSTFLEYSDIFFKIAKKYSDRIEIALKPHPLLRDKLSNNFWGQVKTDDYFKSWTRLPNTILSEGSYEDLFMTSDALIHDCGSFLIEYLATLKPSLFLRRDLNVDHRMNEAGSMALSAHYKGDNIQDIENFIEEVVLNGKDEMNQSRENVFTKIVKPPNNNTASFNIYNEIKSRVQQ